MIDFFGQPSRRAFFLKAVLPIFAAALILNLGAFLILIWATDEADYAAAQRQQRVVDVVVSQMRDRIAHEQESVTVWDDALNAVLRAGAEAASDEWIDLNLGSWMGSYFGHDGAYVLDPKNQPTYAYSDGAVRDPQAFSAVAGIALPLAVDLRARLRAGDTTGLNEQTLSLGATDVAILMGRPAIVSVKPIVSDSGEIEQTAGEEYLHVAVRYLDGKFLEELQSDYLLEELRFSWTREMISAEAVAPLQAADQSMIGYFAWQPYRPGGEVLGRVLPAMGGVSLASLAALGLFVMTLRRRSLKLSLSEATVRHLAHHDLLTGLPNRAQLATRLDDMLRKLGDDRALAILYLDLDQFKAVNDTLGHPCGDELLREVADRLRRLTGEGDTVARLGGDEFVIVLPNIASEEQVKALCTAIIESARNPFNLAGTQVFIGMSIGVAFSPRDGRDRIELARRADVALYQAKRSGRSTFAVYSAELDDAVKARRAFEADLRMALDAPGQLQVHYQPLLSARERRITGVEALLRWRHPSHGWISPAMFIPLAEESGLIDKLGDLVMRTACARAAEWPIETLAVNVSIKELQEEGYALRVANILMSTGMSPQRLELEVTESAFSDKAGGCERNIAALRELGVRFALDDFGTGFSSLGRLHQLAVDRLKIDRSFVAGFGKDSGDEAIVQAIIDLAKAVGLKTTAEGVETIEQQDYLDRVGCDEFQGFLISKPVPPEQIEEMWRRESARPSPALMTV